MTKKTFFVATTLLIALFALASCNGDKDSNSQDATRIVGDSIVGRLPLAYVDLDSLMTKYTYAIEMQEDMMREMESRQATVNSKGRTLESEMKEFQRKIETNAFLSQERAQREQERILKLQQEFQQLNQKLQVELMQLEAEKTAALTDTIKAHVQKYNNEVGKYQMILTSNAGGIGTIVAADPSYNITEQVVKYLNDNYTPAKKEEAAK